MCYYDSYLHRITISIFYDDLSSQHNLPVKGQGCSWQSYCQEQACLRRDSSAALGGQGCSWQ